MKRILFVGLITLIFSAPTFASEPISSFQFRRNMHEVFRNYRGMLLAADEGNTEAARAHVKLGRDYLAKTQSAIPAKDAEGVPINKEKFLASIQNLDKTMASLDKALGAGAKSEIAELPKTIFSLCVGCHREAKLKYMFRLPQGQKLLGEYMHSIAENYEMASIYMESGENEDAAQHLAIVNQYLSLLKRIFPDKGPSGVIMSRDRLVNQIKEVEGYNQLIQEDIKQGKTSDFAMVKKSLNLICVSCHEPDRIR